MTRIANITGAMARHKVRTVVVGTAATLALAGITFASIILVTSQFTGTQDRVAADITLTAGGCNDLGSLVDPTLNGSAGEHLASCSVTGKAVTLTNSYGTYSPRFNWTVNQPSGQQALKIERITLVPTDGGWAGDAPVEVWTETGVTCENITNPGNPTDLRFFIVDTGVGTPEPFTFDVEWSPSTGAPSAECAALPTITAAATTAAP